MLVRAAVALVFGAVTVFWAAPPDAGMGWAGGLYLLATGVVMIWTVTKTGFRPREGAGRILSAGGAALAGAGAAVALIPAPLVFGTIAAAGPGRGRRRGAVRGHSSAAAGPCWPATGSPPA